MPHAIGPVLATKELAEEIDQWCVETAGEAHTGAWHTTGKFTRIMNTMEVWYVFQDKNHALLFKLRWSDHLKPS